MKSVIAETIDVIIEKSLTPPQDVWVDDLVIGIFFTGIKLSTGHAGVAFTPIGEIPEAVCCPTTAARMPQSGNLEGSPVSEILISDPDGVIKILKQGDSAYHLLNNCSEKIAFAKT
jgi:hypothetical protein